MSDGCNNRDKVVGCHVENITNMPYQFTKVVLIIIITIKEKRIWTIQSTLYSNNCRQSTQSDNNDSQLTALPKEGKRESNPWHSEWASEHRVSLLPRTIQTAMMTGLRDPTAPPRRHNCKSIIIIDFRLSERSPSLTPYYSRPLL